jgi:hypothetical protein
MASVVEAENYDHNLTALIGGIFLRLSQLTGSGKNLFFWHDLLLQGLHHNARGRVLHMKIRKGYRCTNNNQKTESKMEDMKSKNCV